MLNIPLRVDRKRDSSQEIRDKLRETRETFKSVRSGLENQLLSWSKAKAKRESERIARYERSSLPTVYQGPHIVTSKSSSLRARKPIPELHSVKQFTEQVETSD